MLTPSDVDRFFRAKGMQGSCHACSKSTWMIAEPPGEKMQWVIGGARDDGGVVIPTPSIPILVLICENCFSVRTHAEIAIKNWLDQNPASKEKP